jgi:WD40 repeat protein
MSLPVRDTGSHAIAIDVGMVDRENPWPGLAAFREADQEFFYGREAEVEEILRLVLRERLSVLFGLSGLGKTSLLQAGLFPRLRQENVFPVYVRLDYSESGEAESDEGRRSLTGQIRDAIAAQAAAWAIEGPPFPESETLWESFHRQQAEFWNVRNRRVTPLLVFDQFEELLTLGRRSATRAREIEELLDELVDLAEGSVPASVRARLEEDPAAAREFSFSRHAYKILISLREDFLPDLEGLRGRLRSIVTNRLRLTRMNGAQALQVVIRPGGHLIDAATAAQVVRFVAGGAEESETPLAGLEVEPALLSVVCRELNNKRRRQQAPRITADLLQGNRDEILTDFYERSVADLGPEVRTFVEERLLTVSGFRDSVALENALELPGVTREALDKLTDRRLLRIEDRGGVERLELTHDVLTGVIRASRDRRRQREAQARSEQARRDAEARERIARQQLRRSRRLSLLLLFLMLAAVVTAGWVAVLRHRVAQAQAQVERSVLEVANRLVEMGQASDALALFAHVARRHPDDLAPRSWLLDLLLHGGWPVPVTVMRHPQGVKALDLSPDGRRMVTACADGKARIWDLATGQIEGVPLAHRAPVSFAAVSPDGRLVATASEDGTARLWNLRTGAPQGPPLRHEREVAVVRFSPDGRVAATASADGSAGLWETATGRHLFTLRHGGTVWALAFSADGELLATASEDGEARTWDVRTGRPVAKFLHRRPVWTVGLSPDSTRVVSGSDDGATWIWDARTGGTVRGPLRHTSAIYDVRFSPDGRRVVTGSDDNTAQVWDAATGRPVGAMLHQRSSVVKVSFSADGRRVLTATEGGVAQVWEAETGRPVVGPLRHARAVVAARFDPRDGRRIFTASADGTARLWQIREESSAARILSQGGPVRSVRFSPEGRLLAVASSDGTARLLDAATGRPYGSPLRHAADVTWAAFSPSGRRLVTSSLDRTARVWDVATRLPVGEPLRHRAAVQYAEYSPDGRAILTAASDGTARLWDAATLRPALTLRHGGEVLSARFSPDGRRAVTASKDATAGLWEMPSGKRFGPPLRHGAAVSYAAFSPDGRVAVTTSEDGTARLWEVPTGRLRHTLVHPAAVPYAAFRPDGQRLATADDDDVVRIWDVEDGHLVLDSIRHDNKVWLVQFSPDGRRLVTASEDNTARLWDAATGLAIARPLTHGGGAWVARFSPDGQRVATGSADGTVRLWNTPAVRRAGTEALVALAGSISGRELDHEGKLVAVADPLAGLRTFRELARGIENRPPYLDELLRRFAAPGQ